MKTSEAQDKGRGLLILIGIILASVLIYVLTQLRTDPILQTQAKGEVMTGLFVITSGDKPLMNQIFMQHPATQKTAILDIPSQTGAFLEDQKRYDAIDRLWDRQQPQAYLLKIEEMTGITLSYHILLDLEGLSRVVDLLSGVELFLSNSYEDLSKEPFVLIPPGTSILDGNKIRDYLSFQDEGESAAEKIGRYQKFLQSFLRSMGNKASEITHPRSLTLFHKALQTNLDELALGSLAHSLEGSDLERTVFLRVMGDQRLVDGKTLLFPHYNGNLLKETVKQVLVNLASADTLLTTSNQVTLEILNGTATNGLAGRTAQIYRSYNYEIPTTKNHTSLDVEKTVVIDRKGNLELARQVAELIQCQVVLSGPEHLDDSPHEITIILGKDFDGRYVKN